MSKTYQSSFTKPITIETNKDAVYTITHFCDYCEKSAIEQFHCSGRDADICSKVKEQIASDFSSPKGE
jgi:hypothetical protein